MEYSIIFCAFFALFSLGNASPVNSREKRFLPYTGGYAYAGPGFGFGFPFPYGGLGAGSFAGAGAGSYAGGYPSWDSYPRTYFPSFPWAPFPALTFPKNWYEGDNVCKDVKIVNLDSKGPAEELDQWLNDGDFQNVKSSFNQESESCRGNGKKFVCVKKIYDGKESKLEATKYECCYGFVRNSSGPGCVESSPQKTNGSGEKTFYEINPPQQSSGSQQSGSSSSSSVSQRFSQKFKFKGDTSSGENSLK